MALVTIKSGRSICVTLTCNNCCAHKSVCLAAWSDVYYVHIDYNFDDVLHAKVHGSRINKKSHAGLQNVYGIGINRRKQLY